MVDELSVELSLTGDQRQQVEKILADTRQQFQDLRKQYHPQMTQIRDSSHEKISSLLTPEQKVHFDEWKQRQDAKRDRRRNEDSPKERR
jgi:Spy/CpxP family protein refolding chaperone